MNKTETKKLAAIVAKSSNQKEAVLSWFAKGNSVTRDGALGAGIGDAKRVVNRLRADGIKVIREQKITRKSNDIVYSLADKQTKKAQKQIAALA